MLKITAPLLLALISSMASAQTSSGHYLFKKRLPDLVVEYTPVGGELTLSTTSLSFGAKSLNEVIPTLSVQITNSSSEIVPVTVSNSGPFSSDTNCPVKLNPSQSCVVNVLMDTSSAGAKSGQIIVSNSAQTSTVSLSGSVVNYALSVSSSDLQLGNKTYGSLVTAEVLFTNSGSGPLSGFYVPMPSGWSSSSATSCSSTPSTLAAGSSCTFQMRRMAESGLKTTNIVAYSSSLSAPVTSVVTYTGSSASQVVFKLTGETGAIADESPAGVALLGNSNKPTISTSSKVYGAASYYFAPGADYIRTPEVSQFAFGTGDFTVEGWFYIQSWNSSGFLPLIDFRYHYWNEDRPALYYSNGSIMWATGNGQNISTSAFSLNSWNHVAYARKDMVGYLFINGQLRAATSDPKNYSVNTGITIGQAGDAQNGALTCTFCDVKGFVDNVRVTKGAALYTSSFTPTDF